MDSTLVNVTFTVGNLEYHFMEGEELDVDYADIARKELREIPAIRTAGIEELRKLILADTELKFPTDNDFKLLVFLRPCKFYAESAYQLIQRYYQFRLNNPKLYDNLTPANETYVFQQEIFSVLPKRDQYRRHILLMEPGAKWNPSKCTIDEIFRCAAIFLEAAVIDSKNQVAGVVLLVDQSGLSFNHLRQFSINFARTFIYWIQHCLPIRLKAIHIVNQPYIANMIFALFKPFMQEKLSTRLHFHGSNRRSLLKHINAEALPERYGGVLDVPEVPGSKWHELMMTRNDYFELLSTYGYKK